MNIVGRADGSVCYYNDKYNIIYTFQNYKMNSTHKVGNKTFVIGSPKDFGEMVLEKMKQNMYIQPQNGMPYVVVEDYEDVPLQISKETDPHHLQTQYEITKKHLYLFDRDPLFSSVYLQPNSSHLII